MVGASRHPGLRDGLVRKWRPGEARLPKVPWRRLRGSHAKRTRHDGETGGRLRRV